LSNVHVASRGALQLLTACRNRRKAKVAVDGAVDAALEVAEPSFGPQWRAVRLRRLHRKPTAPGAPPPSCKPSWKNPPGWILGGETGHRLLAVPASLRNQEGRLQAEWTTVLPTQEGGRRAVLMALSGMDLNSHNAENPAAGPFTVHFEAWSHGPYPKSLAIFGISLGAHHSERGCFTLPRDYPISFAKLNCVSYLRGLVGQAFAVPGISTAGAVGDSSDLMTLRKGIQECVTCLLDHEDLCDCCCGGWRIEEELASPFSSEDVLGGLYHGQLVVHPQPTQSSLMSAFDMDRFTQDLWIWWKDTRACRPGPSVSSTLDHSISLPCSECRSCGMELNQAGRGLATICEICVQHRATQSGSRPATVEATYRCRDCGQGLPKDKFSKKQFSGPASQRRCVPCVENALGEIQQRSTSAVPATGQPGGNCSHCQQCLQDKPACEFSKSQRSNPANSRRCRSCVSVSLGALSANDRTADVEPPLFSTSAPAVGSGSVDSVQEIDPRRPTFVATISNCVTERYAIKLPPSRVLEVVSSEPELCWVEIDSFHDSLMWSSLRTARAAVMTKEHPAPTDVDVSPEEHQCFAGERVYFLANRDGWAEVIKNNSFGFVPYCFLQFE